MITQQRLKELFDYNKDTGIFINKVRRGRYHAGTQAGYLNKDGYFRININNKLYLAHRLAWLYVYGELPEYIDHINRNPTDNKICNLRAVSKKQNQENREKQANNKSGYKGVSWDTQRKKWFSCIQHKYKTIGLGRYDNKEDAYKAYCNAAAKYHTHNPDSLA
jgi:hypothetical protein